MIVSVVGGRPNLIKLAALSNLFPSKFNHVVLHTGQHYDYELSQIFFSELNLPMPDANLGVGSSTQAIQTSRIIVACEKYFLQKNPKIVLVYGDMNSTLGAAIAAAKLNIPVFHIESGTRSFDRSIPEEVNRIIVDHISTILFTPTKTALGNLSREGLKKRTIHSGDTTYETFLNVGKKLSEGYYKNLNLERFNYCLATVHRPSNTDNKNNLNFIFNGLSSLKRPVVVLLHPRTKKMLIKFNIFKNLKNSNLIIISPVKYTESLSLQKYAEAIITDSSGVQKEAYFLKVPCITLRNTTEWPETISLGWNHLWFPKKENLNKLITEFNKPIVHPTIFGNGKAGKIIVQAITDFLEK